MHIVDQSTTIRDRVERLLKVVPKNTRLLVGTHDNPDPDSIASAYALGELLKAKRGVDYTITYDGVLGRAENREMVRLLKVPLVPFRKIKLDQFDMIGLVDAQFEMENHPFRAEKIADHKTICVDHHPIYESDHEKDFADIGGHFGATSTVLTHYLHAAKVEPSTELASALFYGVKSDTRDLGRQSSDEDKWAYAYLVERADMPAISAIEHPKLPRAYFNVLAKAIRRAKVFDDVVTCDVGELYIPDLVAEIADKLALSEGIRWSIVVGQHKNAIYASLRVNDKRCAAGKLVRAAVKNIDNASAGGHGSMAGARITMPEDTSPSKFSRWRKKLIRACVEEIFEHYIPSIEPFAPAVDQTNLNIRGHEQKK